MNVLDTFSLKGKVAVVTGGAGNYGKQIVLALAEAGAETYIAARKLEASEKVAQDYRALGHNVKALHLDLAKEESILTLRDEVIKQSGKIDILVNNAVLQFHQDWNDDADKFAQSMQVNATGVFIITRAFGNLMAEQKSGSIINIASVFGMVAPNVTHYEGGLEYLYSEPDYHFHKGGLINFTKYVASYYGRQNVRCNAISPGAKMAASLPAAFKTKELWQTSVERWSRRTQLFRLGEETFLKGAVVFLASDASSYMTGANIPVDGGYTAI